MKINILLSLSLFSTLWNFSISQVTVTSSNKNFLWKTENYEWNKVKTNTTPDIVLNPEKIQQTIEGWGGCFNEKGWKALKYLSEKDRKALLKLLFSSNACSFSYCRMPIGASDYALDYYSLNDNNGDYKMKKFSIERDRKYLIPYIKSAQKINPNLKIWGSPWTPPAWMKNNNNYARGRIKMNPKILEAYALYFQKFVESYRSEGINIAAIHPQNEPLHLPSFPSCGWNGEQLKIFIRDYLGPKFEQNLPDCEIWLGTINGNDKTNEFSEYIQPVFQDKNTSKYITGAGFQWDGDSAVEQMQKEFPDKKIMQTETKCGWGENNWDYAFQTFNQMIWYLKRNASYYMQWNMVLDETGMSSWGWKQNAMISVDTYKKEYQINPQYWAVRHFTQFIHPGAVRISSVAKKGIQSLAFKNLNNDIILVYSNQTKEKQEIIIQIENKYIKTILPSETISTALIR